MSLIQDLLATTVHGILEFKYCEHKYRIAYDSDMVHLDLWSDTKEEWVPDDHASEFFINNILEAYEKARRESP